MRSLIFQFILLLLFLVGCHKHEDEFVPVPDASAVPAPGTSNDDPPLSADSSFFEFRLFDDMPYRLLLPRDFDPSLAYPMFVFLHGMGERGSNNESQLNIGSSFFLHDSVREAYPAFIVYPQCPTRSYWFDSRMTSLVKELIDSLCREFQVIRERIAIGGFSMGAYGTFEIASRYPGFFEAALAISGDGDESDADRMAQTRWRIFAGERDDVVPSAKTKKMAEALKRAGASVSFTLYPGVDHGRTWLHAFSEPDLFSWLFQEDKPIFADTPIRN